MSLHLLPARIAGAAENMAVDFLLLQRYPEASAPRFRHYGWRRATFTFGYAQKIGWVREQLRAAAGEAAADLDLCRRPTGGGLVDHRDDWTYALVIPRGHPLEELRAARSYQLVHEALAVALRLQGIPAQTKRPEVVPGGEAGGESGSTGTPAAGPAGVCFQRAEIQDVVNEQTGEKIAGAAQKRNKHGLLFQGSVWRPAAGGGAVDWERFHADFTTQLASALAGAAQSVPWPELNEDEVSGLTEQYASPEWIELR